MMIRSLLAVATVAFALAGCDRTTSLLVTPELETETSFEGGLDSWTVDRAATSGGSGAVTTGDASDGGSYLRITLDQGGDFVWLERAFTLEPGVSYNVTVSADLRTFTGSGDLRVAAGVVNPDGTGFASEGPVPGPWTRTLAPRPVTADAQGRVWVAVGVAGTGQAGAFGVDRLGAVFVRTGES